MVGLDSVSVYQTYTMIVRQLYFLEDEQRKAEMSISIV